MLLGRLYEWLVKPIRGRRLEKPLVIAITVIFATIVLLLNLMKISYFLNH